MFGWCELGLSLGSVCMFLQRTCIYSVHPPPLCLRIESEDFAAPDGSDSANGPVWFEGFAQSLTLFVVSERNFASVSCEGNGWVSIYMGPQYLPTIIKPSNANPAVELGHQLLHHWVLVRSSFNNVEP